MDDNVMKRMVGIGQFITSNQQTDILITYALASCIGITMYSPSKKVLGMAHIALPFSSINNGGNKDQPAYYADKAIPLLLTGMATDYGCTKNELIIHLYGGAQSIRTTDCFQIGSRNLDAVKAILSSNFLPFDASETEGTISRTIEMDVATGKAKIISHPMIV